MLFNTFHFAYFFASPVPTGPAPPPAELPPAGRELLLLRLLGPAVPRAAGPLDGDGLRLRPGRRSDRGSPRKRKLFVALSMALNLGMLGYFKYFNFFAESLHAALARAGLHVPLAHLEVVLPIGISFYTFQSMSYVIDVYRRDIKPTRNFIEFAAFVSFFPHLVAGPIMRPTTLLPQIARPRRFDLQQFYQGSYLIFWGLTKKVVVADNLALIVNDLFGQWQTIDGGLALIAIYAFAFQIYCDFSGYTDAARGIAKCLGFELALNFNLPYFATSPQDFWARWHISLSTWLRDYLYIPLGGSRGGTVIALPQPDADDDHRRPLARRGLDVRALGRLPGRPPGRAPAGPPLARPDPPDRADRPRLLEGPADRGDVPPGLLRLAPLPGAVARAGRGHAPGDRGTPGDPGRGVPPARAVLVLPLLVYQVAQYLSKDLDVIGADPLVRAASRVLHGLLLRLRARGRVRRRPVHLLPVLKSPTVDPTERQRPA